MNEGGQPSPQLMPYQQRFLDAHDPPQQIRGVQRNAVIMDDYASVSPEVMDAVTRGFMSEFMSDETEARQTFDPTTSRRFGWAIEYVVESQHLGIVRPCPLCRDNNVRLNQSDTLSVEDPQARVSGVYRCNGCEMEITFEALLGMPGTRPGVTYIRTTRDYTPSTPMPPGTWPEPEQRPVTVTPQQGQTRANRSLNL